MSVLKILILAPDLFTLDEECNMLLILVFDEGNLTFTNVFTFAGFVV